MKTIDLAANTCVSRASASIGGITNDDIASDPSTPSIQGQIGRLIGLGMAVVLIGFGGFAAWAALVPLDRAISGAGVLVVANHRQTVQPVTGGRIRTIEVSEGQHVQQGQRLVSLQTAAAEAELAAVRRQRTLTWASLERLRVELLAGDDHRATLTWPADLRDYAAAAGADDVLAAQRRAFATRGGHQHSSSQQSDARLRQLNAERDGQRRTLAAQTEQRQLLEEQLASLQSLGQSGHYPRIKLIELARDLAALRGAEAAGQSELRRLDESWSEARAYGERQRAGLARDAEGELQQAEGRHAELIAREAALHDQIAHSQLRAPVAGTVVGLNVHTIDGVVQAAQTLLSIVPDGEPFVAEARLPLGATERLGAGQTVRLRFTSMEHASTPIVDGTVLTVAADRLEDARSGEPYLLVRASVPNEEIARLAAAGLPLRAGLPVELLINVGQRTLASYLLKPMADGFARALIE